METTVKVFDISTKVKAIDLNTEQRKNILNIFDNLTLETHLTTKCFLDTRIEGFESSPIYYYTKSNDKSIFDFKRIAADLLQAELKTNKTRNSTIREGLLFIKADENRIFIMKLEKLEVIDKDTYEIKSELGKEKDYFKMCSFLGDFENILVIDKNRTAAKYWYEKFLGLQRKRTPEDNTNEVLRLLAEKKFYSEEIVNRDNYAKIKKFTEYYMFDNKIFDKSHLFDALNVSGLLELKKEDELFSSDSMHIDSDFSISEAALNSMYQRKFQTSEEVTITTKNYLESIRDNQIIFDEKNKKLIINIEDQYLKDVKEKLGNG